MRKKRCPFTLLEIMIAITLMGILSTVLFSSLRHVLFANAEIQRLKQESHSKVVFKHRLEQMFSKLSNEKKGSAILDYQEKPISLTIQYKNGLERDSKFWHTVEGKLYIDQESKTIWLKTISKEGQREEILFQGAKGLSFLFFNPETKKWEEKWDSPSEVPLMLQVRIERIEDEPLDFAFFLDSNEQGIVFNSNL